MSNKRIDDLERRVTEHDRDLGRIGGTLATTADVVKGLAPQKQADRIEATQKNEIIPAVASNRQRIDTMESDKSGWAARVREYFAGIRGIGGWAAVLTLVLIVVGGLYGCRKELADIADAATSIAKSEREQADADERDADAEERAAAAAERKAAAEEAQTDALEEIADDLPDALDSLGDDAPDDE